MEGIKEKLKGLSPAEAARRLKSYGPNVIEEKKVSLIAKMIKEITSPISLMFILAAGLSYLDHKIFDFYFILLLWLINFSVSFWQERKADNAIKQLNKYLKIDVRVLRGGKWKSVDSSLLVPGDIIEVFVGDVIPADLKVVDESNFSVNEAALTGESLPVEKLSGATVYSGAFVVTGQSVAEVTATGKGTYFGKVIMSIENGAKRSLLERDIITISKFLSVLSFIAVVVLSTVFFVKNFPLLEILTLDLSLVIAGIPIALPTIMTLIISLGVQKLSRENVVVRRLSSLENLANVNLLFTDKTGTLTKNKIVVSQILPYEGDEGHVLRYARMPACENCQGVIDQAIVSEFEKRKVDEDGLKGLDFIPADSSRKRSSALIEKDGKEMYVSVGAPQVIAGLCLMDESFSERFQNDVYKAAEHGFRTLAVAVNFEKGEEGGMRLIGLIMLSDELRDDAKTTIEFLRSRGVRVKMLTGDHHAIGMRVGESLGISKKDIYCEVLPADKYNLVAKAKAKNVVAVTGDGVNDLPALKAADVGFAVSNAVPALKGAADMVLLSSGISVITTAIIEARRIFARIYSYSVYRISESFRVIITILVLGLILREYPLTPIQLILLAILNDIPMVSLAFNRVNIAKRPSTIDVKGRFILSTLFGLVGIVNSLLFLVIAINYFHYGWSIISTAFFLKLTVSGHMLLFVAHTDKPWYKFLPSKEVVIAVLATQALGTFLAAFGALMHPIPWSLVAFVWVWSFIWMQVSDVLKLFKHYLANKKKKSK